MLWRKIRAGGDRAAVAGAAVLSEEAADLRNDTYDQQADTHANTLRLAPGGQGLERLARYREVGIKLVGEGLSS